MAKAFLDTTILADAILKRGVSRDKALIALKRYESIEFPVYAIKEFKAGALYGWVWLHNKLTDTRSCAKTFAAIQSIMTYKRNLPATAIGALSDLGLQGKTTFAALQQQYGADADPDVADADRLRSAARVRIFLAWRNRRSLGSAVVPLSCYSEREPREEPNGLLTCSPTGCGASECAMAPALKANEGDLKALRDAVLKQPKKSENDKRSLALKELIRGRPLTDKLCRALGDAVFAFFAPRDSVILTTNVRDHQPLAAALEKRVEAP